MAEALNEGNITEWFGNYHLIFVHFPIALILMAGFSEILYLVTKNPKYEFTTKFLLIAGALFCIPTVLSGLAFEEGGNFNQENSDTFWWHQTFGFATLVLSILTILILTYVGRHLLYFVCFALLIVSVIAAAHFGGVLAFGPLKWIPPFSTVPQLKG